jgi:peptidyl-prolyl cis-trans isomerase C
MSLRSTFLAFLFIASAPALATVDPATVLASDGQVEVTVADFDAAVAAMSSRQQAAVRGDARNIQNVIDALFMHRVLAREARTEGLDQDDEARRVIEQAVERSLAQMRLQQVGERVRPEAVAQLARERYQANREQYRLPEEADATHILIRVEEGAPEEAALVRIEALKAEIEAGADFAALAREHSEDPGSAANGGALGTFGRGRMVPAFEEAVFATESGQIAGPVRTGFGFHLIRVNERRDARQLSFDEVRETLETEVSMELQQAERDAHVQALRQSGSAGVNWDAVNALIEGTR